MPQQLVFPCPSCGASLSADPSANTVQCQFCGTTSAIPPALRSRSETPLSPDLPPAASSYYPGQPADSPPPAAPYYVPMMTPAIPDGNKIFKGVMGFNIALTLAIFGFTACIFLFVFAAVGLAFVPFFGSFGSLFPH
jgi:hypothetical protein